MVTCTQGTTGEDTNFREICKSMCGKSSKSRNVHKKYEALIPGMCNALSQVILIFSEGTYLTTTVKIIILRKCGLTKVAFERLASVNMCVG